MILALLQPTLLREQFQAMLSEEYPGEKIVIAQDEQSALEIAFAEKPSVFVTEYNYPGSGPIYLMRQVRGQLPKTRIVVFIGSIGQQEMAEAGGAALCIPRDAIGNRLSVIFRKVMRK